MRPTTFLDQLPEKPLVLDWTFARDMVWLHNPPPIRRACRRRACSGRPCSRRLRRFLDERRDSIPAMFSSTVFMPWLKWMDMGERPGHLVWHAAGAKLTPIEDLPSEYRRRAEQEYPQLMTANPAAARAVPADF